MILHDDFGNTVQVNVYPNEPNSRVLRSIDNMTEYCGTFEVEIVL